MSVEKERAGARRDGQPIWRDQIVWLEPCSADHEQYWPLLYVCIYGYTYSKSMDQPGKVGNSARGQLNIENKHFPVRVRAWEVGLARRVWQSRPASACLFPYSG